MRNWLSLAAVVVILDQLSKQLAVQQLSLHQPLALMPSVNLTLLHNTGASFGLLAHEGGWQRWFFITIALVVCWYLYRWLQQLGVDNRLSASAIVLIIGGAVGNLLDRLFYGYVIDFIDVYYGVYHWPVFNLADSAITLGAVMLVIMALFDPKRNE